MKLRPIYGTPPNRNQPDRPAGDARPLRRAAPPGLERHLHSTVPRAVPLDVGRCADFGAVISAGCDHLMQVDGSSCRCPGCGTVCRGKFSGCPEVWAGLSGSAKPVTVRTKPPAPDPTPRPAPPAMHRARSEAWLKALQASPPIVADAPPLRTPPVPLTPSAPPIAFAAAPAPVAAPAPPAAPVALAPGTATARPATPAPRARVPVAPPSSPPRPPAAAPAPPAPPPVAAERPETDPVRPKRAPRPKEEAASPQTDVDAATMRDILEQSYERLSADLAKAPGARRAGPGDRRPGGRPPPGARLRPGVGTRGTAPDDLGDGA